MSTHGTRSTEEYEHEIARLKARIRELENHARRRLVIETQMQHAPGERGKRALQIAVVQKVVIDGRRDPHPRPPLPQGEGEEQKTAETPRPPIGDIEIEFSEPKPGDKFLCHIFPGGPTEVRATGRSHEFAGKRMVQIEYHPPHERPGARITTYVDPDGLLPTGDAQASALTFDQAMDMASARGDFSPETMEQLKEIGDRQAMERGKAVGRALEDAFKTWQEQRGLSLLGSGE